VSENLNVREIRKHLGLTITDLARECGVVYMTAYRWDRGERQPDPRARRRIAELIDAAARKAD